MAFDWSSYAPNAKPASVDEANVMAAVMRNIAQEQTSRGAVPGGAAAAADRFHGIPDPQAPAPKPQGGFWHDAWNTIKPAVHAISTGLSAAERAAPAYVAGTLDTIGSAIHGNDQIDWQGLQKDPEFQRYTKGIDPKSLYGTKEWAGGTGINPDFYNKLGDNNPLKAVIDRHRIGGGWDANIKRNFNESQGQHGGLGNYVNKLDIGQNSALRGQINFDPTAIAKGEPLYKSHGGGNAALGYEAGAGDVGLNPAMYVGFGPGKVAAAGKIAGEGEKLIAGAEAAGDTTTAAAEHAAMNDAISTARSRGVSALSKDQAAKYGLKQGATFAEQAIPGAGAVARSPLNPATAVNAWTKGAGVVGQLGRVLGATRNPELQDLARSGMGTASADAVRFLRAGKLAGSQGQAFADVQRRIYSGIADRIGNDPEVMRNVVAHAEGSPTAAAALNPEQLQAANDLAAQMHDVAVKAQAAGVPINEIPNYVPRQTTFGGTGLGGGENAPGYFERGRVVTGESTGLGEQASPHDIRSFMNEQAIARGKPEGYYNANIHEVIPHYLDKMGARIGRANLINALAQKGIAMPGMVEDPAILEGAMRSTRGATRAAAQALQLDTTAREAGANAADQNLAKVAEGVSPRGAGLDAGRQPLAGREDVLAAHDALYNDPIRLRGMENSRPTMVQRYIDKLSGLAAKTGDPEIAAHLDAAKAAIRQGDFANATLHSESALTKIHSWATGTSLGERSAINSGLMSPEMRSILDEIGGAKPNAAHAAIDAAAQTGDVAALGRAAIQNGVDPAEVAAIQKSGLNFEQRVQALKDAAVPDTQKLADMATNDPGALRSTGGHLSAPEAKRFLSTQGWFQQLTPEAKQAAFDHVDQVAEQTAGNAHEAITDLEAHAMGGSTNRLPTTLADHLDANLPPAVPRISGAAVDEPRILDIVRQQIIPKTHPEWMGLPPAELVNEIQKSYGSLESFLSMHGVTDVGLGANVGVTGDVMASQARLQALRQQLAEASGGAAKQRLQTQIDEIASQLGVNSRSADVAGATPDLGGTPPMSVDQQRRLMAEQQFAQQGGGAAPASGGAAPDVGLGRAPVPAEAPPTPPGPLPTIEKYLPGYDPAAAGGEAAPPPAPAGPRALNPPPPGYIEDAQIVPNAQPPRAITSQYAGYPPWAQRAFEEGAVPKDMLHEAIAQSDAAHAAVQSTPQDLASASDNVASRVAEAQARLADPGVTGAERDALTAQVQLGQRAQHLYGVAQELAGTPGAEFAQLEAKAADAQAAYEAAHGPRPGAWEGRSLLNPSMNKVASAVVRDGTHVMLQGTDYAAPGSIARALNAMDKVAKDPNALLEKYQQIVRYVKSMTLLQPGTAFRHSIGAFLNNQIDNVALDAYPNALRDVGQLGKGTLDPAWEQKVQALYDSLPRRSGQISAQEIGGQAGGFFERHISAPLLDRLNPFSTQNAAAKFVHGTIGASEDATRFVMGYDTLVKGGTVEDAVNRILQFHFDFNDVTDAEKAIRQNVIPFYTWTRKNLGLQLQMMIEQPGRYLAMYKAQRAFENKTGLALPTPFSSHGLGRLVGIGPDNKFNVGNLTSNVTPVIRQVAEDVAQHGFGATLNPYERVDNKLLGGKQHAYNPFGQAGPLGDAVTSALQAAGLADKNGFVSHNVMTHIANLMPVLGILKRMAPNNPTNQKDATDRWLSFLGLPPSPERQRQMDQAAQDQYKAQGIRVGNQQLSPDFQLTADQKANLSPRDQKKLQATLDRLHANQLDWETTNLGGYTAPDGSFVPNTQGTKEPFTPLHKNSPAEIASGHLSWTDDGRKISYATTKSGQATALANGEVLAADAAKIMPGLRIPIKITIPKASKGRSGGRGSRPGRVASNATSKYPHP